MGCVGARTPAGGILSLTIASNSRRISCCGGILPVLHWAPKSPIKGHHLLLLRPTECSSSSRCCSSAQCSSSGEFSSSPSFSLRSSTFACNELSSRFMRAVNSPLGQRKAGRSLQVRASKDSGPPPEYSSDTKIRSEVISPFRSLRMFFYLAFIASGSIGSLITLTRFAGAFGNAPNAQPIPEILKDLGIDLAAVALFALLYRSDAKARDVSLARLSREEMLSALRVELANKKVVTLQQLRGVARIVIISGSSAYIDESFQQGERFREELLERGVLVVPYYLDGTPPASEPSGSTGQQGVGSVAVQEQPKVAAAGRWMANPIYTSEWARWLNAQKKLANVAEDYPVYISLRLDGRVRGSGVGYPPWEKFSLQLPPMTGLWKGPLDGMDGRI